MKRLMILCVAVLLGGAFTACEKDDKGQLDPNAMISLRPAEGVKAAAVNTQHLTAKEIVEQAANINFYNYALNGDNKLATTFSDRERDIENTRLLMWGTDIISSDGKYVASFIEGEDMIVDRWIPTEKRIDTIAYIPNQVLRDAQKLIRPAYDRGDYTTCYALFDQAFTFLPITGEEWRELKAQGKN